MPESIHIVTYRYRDDPEQTRLERVFTSRSAMEVFLRTIPEEIEVIAWPGSNIRGPRTTASRP